MEKWQIYLYLFFVVTILHAFYDKRTNCPARCKVVRDLRSILSVDF